MLPVIWVIGLGVAGYFTKEAVSKNYDKKKRQAMQSLHVSKVKQLENRINRLKTEIESYDNEITAAKVVKEENFKRIEKMLFDLKRSEHNLAHPALTTSALLSNNYQRAKERKKLQDRYDEQIAELEDEICRLETQVKVAKEKSLVARKDVEISQQNTRKLESVYHKKMAQKRQ
ncbi:hypothetical protein [Vibrio owensii]|uniref:hypothetical protein n=1 Tax=Vibrio owensii TaxID=696485 RepID=UPI0022DDCA04|nr:hypothetical protein [Vibrio owensii]MDA0385964.1 hypothetical protein [Vibrio owensii]